MMAPHPMDNMAIQLFQTAINKGQAGELLECLFDGGSATVDPQGNIVMVTEKQLSQMMGDAD